MVDYKELENKDDTEYEGKSNRGKSYDGNDLFAQLLSRNAQLEQAKKADKRTSR